MTYTEPAENETSARKKQLERWLLFPAFALFLLYALPYVAARVVEVYASEEGLWPAPQAIGAQQQKNAAPKAQSTFYILHQTSYILHER